MPKHRVDRDVERAPRPDLMSSTPALFLLSGLGYVIVGVLLSLAAWW